MLILQIIAFTVICCFIVLVASVFVRTYIEVMNGEWEEIYKNQPKPKEKKDEVE